MFICQSEYPIVDSEQVPPSQLPGLDATTAAARSCDTQNALAELDLMATDTPLGGAAWLGVDVAVPPPPPNVRLPARPLL
jgi:hypothetical protein